MSFVAGLLFVIAMCDLMLPRLMANLVNEGINKGDNDFILRVGLQMLGVSLFAVVFQIIVNYLSALSSMGFGRDLRSEAFRKITYLSLQQTDEYGTASLITRTSSDVREMQMVVQMGLSAVISVPMHMIGGIVMALSMDTRLAVIIIFAMPLLLLIVYLNINWVRPLFETMRDKLDSVSRVLREILSGVRVIRAFNTIDMERERFNETNLAYTDAFKKARRRMALVNPLTTAVMSGATISVYWFGQFRIEAGAMSAGDIMAFSQYVMQILGSVMGLQMVFNMIPSALISSKRLNQILDTKPTVADPENPISPPSGIRGEVRFDNVTFQYPGAEKPVLDNISFTARPGETTAVIGGTGSGKSTIVSLIPRLYDIQGGRILIDHIDITQMAQRDLRSRIGFVTQKAQLFTGSVENNIRFGKSDASLDEIKGAAKVAQAADFIETMAEGYDSFVSQDATNLSGGQKQRISIARAIARDPEVYIFDDSFSAVDFKTDAALRAALKGVTANASVIIVAQRVSTIMDADNIIVLDEGKCVGQGKHASLMQSCDVYREIVYSQLKEEEIA
ncbi:MAG: ABC transporter ATP-binding protein/permease [Oscillospiraceae bacterium]|nr:ABC transporter ATP-binding protein/permease [Oscillospiraceae bacterium]